MLFFLIGFRSLRFALLGLVPLIPAVVCTLAFVRFTFDYLSILTSSFVAVMRSRMFCGTPISSSAQRVSMVMSWVFIIVFSFQVFDSILIHSRKGMHRSSRRMRACGPGVSRYRDGRVDIRLPDAFRAVRGAEMTEASLVITVER